MKLRKMAVGILAAAMAVVSLPQAVSAESAESNEFEYKCSWVDVRPDCQYKLTVKEVERTYGKRCIVRISGIDAFLNRDYTDSFEYEGKEYTVNYGYKWLLIDTNDGKEFFALTLNEKGEIAFSARSIEDNPVFFLDPDENGKYCYYSVYNAAIRSIEYIRGINESFGESDFKSEYIHTSGDETYIQFETYYDEYLLESESTTVLTYSELCSNHKYYVDDIEGHIGILSDGTLIKGDGKRIDCDTGETVFNNNYENSLYERLGCVDSWTDLPKETVKIVYDENISENPDDDTEAPDDFGTITDEETGISVSGAIPEGAQLKVTADTENSTDTRLFYDISLTKDGEEIQPNGTVTVKIPVPEELKEKAAELKVYHFVNDEYTDMNAKLEDNYLVFETDHFSTYVVTSDTIPEDGDDDNKGDDTTTTEPTPAIPTIPSGNFQVPETTTAAATTTEAAPAATEAADNSNANTSAAAVAPTTTTTTTAVTAAPADTGSNGSDTTQPVVSEDNGSDNSTADNGASAVGNDGAANDKGENPDTGSAIAIVPMIVAAAAVSFFAYKRKK